MSTVLEHDSLQLTAWRSLADAYKLVYARVNSDLRRYGLTPPQYAVLRSIGRSENGYLAMNQIGKELLVTYADVTIIVDNLEKRNCLKRVRESKDRRIVRTELTPKGRRLLRKISALHRGKIAYLMSGLTLQELARLIADTTKIRDRILMNLDETAGPEKPEHR